MTIFYNKLTSPVTCKALKDFIRSHFELMFLGQKIKKESNAKDEFLFFSFILFFLITMSSYS